MSEMRHGMNDKLSRECHYCGTVYMIDFGRKVAYYKFMVSHWRHCPMCGHDIREEGKDDPT